MYLYREITFNFFLMNTNPMELETPKQSLCTVREHLNLAEFGCASSAGLNSKYM